MDGLYSTYVKNRPDLSRYFQRAPSGGWVRNVQEGNVQRLAWDRLSSPARAHPLDAPPAFLVNWIEMARFRRGVALRFA
jgi:hypothetical protein